jgi:hypothetical protein
LCYRPANVAPEILMNRLMRNLSDMGARAPLVFPPLLLVCGVAYFNDRWPLFWATIGLAALVVIGALLRRYQG